MNESPREGEILAGGRLGGSAPSTEAGIAALLLALIASLKRAGALPFVALEHFTDDELGAIGELLHTASILPALRDLSPEERRAQVAELNDSCGPIGIDSSISLFESLLADRHGRAPGVVYTPEWLSRLITEHAFARAPLAPNIVLDPASGAGRFLVDALRCHSRSNSGGNIERFLVENLRGIERDPRAAEFSRVLLQLEYMRITGGRPPSLTRTVTAGNSLLSPAECLERGLAAESFAALDIEAVIGAREGGGVGVDLILGNPPYSLSREGRIATEENCLLKDVYRRYRPDKVNLYLLFLARYLPLLSAGGTLAFLIPNAWLGIKSGQPLRELSLNGSAPEIWRFAGRPFRGASVEPIAFFIGGGCEHHSAIRLSQVSSSGSIASCGEIPKSYCAAAPGKRIPLYWSRELTELFSNIRGNHPTIAEASSLFRPLIAMQAYSVGKGSPKQTAAVVRSHAFHTRQPADRSCVPYFEGSDIGRYRICWSGNYLRYGPWLADPQSIERFSGPRILLREICGRPPHIIQAALTEERALYNKSILHILPGQQGTIRDLWGLLAILNSTLGSLLLFFGGSKTQRSLFPKLVLQDLLELPLPAVLTDELVELAQRASAAATTAGAVTVEMESQLDHAVCAVYGLPDEMVGRIGGIFSEVIHFSERQLPKPPAS